MASLTSRIAAVGLEGLWRVDPSKHRARRAAASSLLGWWLLVCTLGVCLPSVALAEPTAADRATARALAREGFEALKQDDFQTAEDRFRRADALVHAPTLVVDHARSLVGLGRLVEAHERYSLVLREGVSPNAAWPWKRAFADAQKEIELIKARLAWLTITISGPEQPQVRIDNREIPAAAIGVRRATDPGERTIRVSAAGFYPKVERVVLQEGEEQSVDIALDPMPEEQLPEPEPDPTPEPVVIQDVSQPAPDNTLAYVALGVGGAGLVTYGVTGVLFLREHSTLKDSCPSPKDCPDDERSSIGRYNALGWVAGIAAGVGVAGAATGLTLLLLNGQTSSAPAEVGRVQLHPYLTPASAGVVGRF